MVRFLCSCLCAALLAGCGPSGECEGFVGATPIRGSIDGDSLLDIRPAPFRPRQEAAIVRGALLHLRYGDGALDLAVQIKLPADQELTDLPLVMTEEEWAQRLPQEGAVSLWKMAAPSDAPRLTGGTFSVELADANNLQGRFDARFEDGSRLECTYDVRGQNYVPGDDPTYNGPP
ncbi:hypothetical protein JRI60_30985 [Archangium violaceum]|uniref:hypothetical protein n=1 Tax=Archangium violaceum TaxID=83451 RepID=UPI00194F8838|nr:hypothetical protein [Archangium violaceum]QRN93589.1 hypothetical protein JRI60_30985 [Archangium violaceum]